MHESEGAARLGLLTVEVTPSPEVDATLSLFTLKMLPGLELKERIALALASDRG